MNKINQSEEDSTESIIAKLKQTFEEEAYELISELEEALLELEKDPESQELIGRVFRTMHTLKGSGAACGLQDISSFTHEIETFFDQVRKGEISVSPKIIDLSIDARDHLKALLDECYRGGASDPQTGQSILESFKRLCVDHGKPSGHNNRREDIQFIQSNQDKIGQILMEAGLRTPKVIEADMAAQQCLRETQQDRKKAAGAATIRVSTTKLDNLVDIVGELVTVQARLGQTARSHQITELNAIAEQVARLATELHDKTMDMRMLPIGTTFSKFRRVVRDLSQELGKEIELATEGAATELDKTVIECLSDPLIHLIRNSADHGIEPPDVREVVGKPRHGTVRLTAAHSGAYVLVQISDDGAGLDGETIRTKAVENGLLRPDAVTTDKELFSLIFTPGFSTAKTITDVSGRGVGLDVVKKTIEKFRGFIELTSQKGKGTTITLKLPLTLAIIDGLLVEIDRESFVLPMSFVYECGELTAEGKQNARGRRIANVRGKIVPYINLREQFLIPGVPPDMEQIVITGIDGGKRVGFVVDRVIGGHQTVIKSLGAFYSEVEGISGTTILGDGTVALILDVPKLVRIVELEENNTFA